MRTRKTETRIRMNVRIPRTMLMEGGEVPPR
jgi:hypothetical protein